MPLIFIYFSLAHFLVLIAALLVRGEGWVQTTEVTDGVVTYRPFYYNIRVVFVGLFVLLVFYQVFMRWLWGWYIDGWALEASIALGIFAFGDLTFIAAHGSKLIADGYQKYRVAYILLRIMVLLWLWGRILYYVIFTTFWLVLAPLTLTRINPYSLNPVPDIRPADASLVGNYYIGYSAKDHFVIEKKVLMFRKDVWKMTGCFGNPSNYDLNVHDPNVDLFPRMRRSKDYVKIYTKPGWYVADYIDFKLDSTGRLQMSSYQVDKSGKGYNLCGTEYIQ